MGREVKILKTKLKNKLIKIKIKINWKEYEAGNK